jgi:hypothetical protein
MTFIELMSSGTVLECEVYDVNLYRSSMSERFLTRTVAHELFLYPVLLDLVVSTARQHACVSEHYPDGRSTR